MFAIPWLLQGAVMTIDEFYYHRRRGLPRWERIGHPLDTLTVLACLLWTQVQAPSSGGLGVYFILAVFSCLFVTKDEFVHAEHCDPGEQWLHSLLFVLHPIGLASAGWAWHVGASQSFFRGQTYLLVAFMAYQIIYWSYVWKPSIMKSMKPSANAGTRRTMIPSRSSAPNRA